LAENRIKVLRFDNKVIYNNVEGIIEAIKGAVQTTPNPSSLGFAACYRRDART
jgi:very-short-patch-repair endonuclease